MAGSARRITVEFLGDAKGLNSTADQVERKTSSLGSKMAHVGKIAAIGLAGGLAAAGVAMVGMVKNGAEDLAAQRKLAVALQNTTGATKSQVAAVETWITKQGVALGVTDDELRPAFQRLVQATGNITQAQKLAGVAMDASAGSGKSLKTVSEAIAKAHNGNLGALSRLGIKIKDTNGKTLTFNQAMAEMGKTFKGQAAAGADTFDGKMGRLKLIFDEVKETIGQAVIPVLSRLAGWFLSLVKHLQSGTGAGSKFREIFAKVGDVVRSIGQWIANELVPTIKDLVHRFWDAIGGTKGLRDMFNNLRPAITLVKSVLGVLWEGLKVAAKVAIPLIVGQLRLWSTTIGAVGRLAIWLWNKAFQPTIKFILQGLGWVIEKFADMLGALGKVPGFGWAKDASDKLHEAAKQAGKFAQGIKDIPSSKEVKIKVKYSSNNGIGSAGQATFPRKKARGGPVTAGMPYIVGEERPELFVPSQNGRIVPRVPERGSAASTVVININGVIDKQGAAREVRKVLLELKRTVGPLGLA